MTFKRCPAYWKTQTVMIMTDCNDAISFTLKSLSRHFNFISV